jgi:formamidopyrimidine-DNA glycosylase
MPELPEVQTTVNGINKRVKNLKITSVWSDLPKKDHVRKEEIKNLNFWKRFKKDVLGKKIKKSERVGKNILIELDDNTTILIHMKMTGHLVYGTYRKGKVSDGETNHSWVWWPEEKALQDPYNRFVHLKMDFENGKSLVFCDSRKFGKVTTLGKCNPKETIHLKHLGPDALDETLTSDIFEERLQQRPNKATKTALLDQELITGIGNIYSDEMLWETGIHPERKVSTLKKTDFKALFKCMKPLLLKGISFGGDSMSDYRNIDGKKGSFQGQHNVYQKKGETCSKRSCKGKIERKVVNGRSAHFCNTHQKLR